MRKLATVLVTGSLLTTAGAAFAQDPTEPDAANEEDTTEERIAPEDDAFPEEDPTADVGDGAEEEASPVENRRTAKNSVYLELLGPGMFYSVNYDRVITDDFSARIGFSYLSIGTSASSGGTTASAEASYWAIPVTANYLGLSAGNHALELGAGASLMNLSGDVGVGADTANGSLTTGALTGVVGYRRQAPRGGFNFRIGASPMVFFDGTYLTWGYMSFGATF